MINRYGEAIEYDLFDHGGWDLLDFFRGSRPWPQLLRLIDKLPPLSQLKRAIADDDELARQAELRAAGQQMRSSRPTLANWSEMDDLKATLIDGFTLVQLAIASQNIPKGKSAPTFKPAPRPKTAWQRAERRRSEQTHRDIVAMVRRKPPPDQ